MRLPSGTRDVRTWQRSKLAKLNASNFLSDAKFRLRRLLCADIQRMTSVTRLELFLVFQSGISATRSVDHFSTDFGGFSGHLCHPAPADVKLF